MTRYLFVLVVVLLFSSITIAQPTATVTPKPAPSPTPPVKLDKLDPTVIDDIADIARWVEQLKDDLAKSEFETVAQYKARIEKLAIQTTNPKTKRQLDQTFLVVKWNADYDAETGRFLFRDNLLHSRVDVCEWQLNQWLLQTVEPPSYTVDATKAREIKPDLRIAFTGTPVQARSLRLCIVPDRYVIFNEKTNEIYKVDELRIFDPQDNGILKPVKWNYPFFVKRN